jgi:hypothetical protein
VIVYIVCPLKRSVDVKTCIRLVCESVRFVYKFTILELYIFCIVVYFLYVCSMSISKREVYSANPFKIEHKHIVRMPKRDGKEVIEMCNADMQKHIRIFPEMYDDMELLSAMALKLIVYIFSELKDDVDDVFIDIDAFIRFTNRRKIGGDEQKSIGNRAGIYRGIDDLIERNIIARKTGDGKQFYINPAKFFCGSRDKWYDKMKSIPKEMRSILIDIRINGQKGNW